MRETYKVATCTGLQKNMQWTMYALHEAIIGRLWALITNTIWSTIEVTQARPLMLILFGILKMSSQNT